MMAAAQEGFIKQEQVQQKEFGRKSVENLRRGVERRELHGSSATYYMAVGDRLILRLPQREAEGGEPAKENYLVFQRTETGAVIFNKQGKRLSTVHIKSDDQLITIGGGAGNSLILKDGPLLSRNHLKMRMAKNGLVEVTDTSTNGTIVQPEIKLAEKPTERIDRKAQFLAQVRNFARRLSGKLPINPTSMSVARRRDMLAPFGAGDLKVAVVEQEYLASLARRREAYVDRVRFKPEMSDVRVKLIEGKTLMVPEIKTANDWLDLAFSLPDISVKKGETIKLEGIFAIEDTGVSGKRYGALRASID